VSLDCEQIEGAARHAASTPASQKMRDLGAADPLGKIWRVAGVPIRNLLEGVAGATEEVF
jgi:hypothetical protein